MYLSLVDVSILHPQSGDNVLHRMLVLSELFPYCLFFLLFGGFDAIKKSFAVRGAELWNSVPLSVRQIEDCQRFKKLLKEWIAKNVVKFL